MKIRYKAALAALVLGLLPMATPALAREGVSISVDFGTVAFGYYDGYWDRDHRWHRWQGDERVRFRRDYREHYYGRRHDRYRNHGWRGHDRYWERDHRR